MELHGTRFGTIGYAPDDLILLPDGLIGMPDRTNFLILDFEEETPFKWMQSVDDPGLGFVISEPTLFRQDYSLALETLDLRDLDVSGPEELAVFVICTYRGNWDQLTGNLMGPIIVHVAARRGRQVIVEDSPFTTHENLSGSELKESTAAADAPEGDDSARRAAAAAEAAVDESALQESIG